jgi:hypothetical protein
MNRCKTLMGHLSRYLLAALLCTATALAGAQTAPRVRDFPKEALRGKLVVVQPPEITLDGKAERLSPGSRIRGADNMLRLSGTLIGQELTVNFVREGSGLISLVWILTDEELALPQAAATPPRSFSTIVDPAPPRDDGKTPFDQLPKYPQR